MVCRLSRFLAVLGRLFFRRLPLSHRTRQDPMFVWFCQMSWLSQLNLRECHLSIPFFVVHRGVRARPCFLSYSFPRSLWSYRTQLIPGSHNPHSSLKLTALCIIAWFSVPFTSRFFFINVDDRCVFFFFCIVLHRWQSTLTISCIWI